MQAQEKPSLYDRLGGVYDIATVIDDLSDRAMVDARLNANPRVDEAHHRVSAAGFKFLVTEMLHSARTSKRPDASRRRSAWAHHPTGATSVSEPVKSVR